MGELRVSPPRRDPDPDEPQIDWAMLGWALFWAVVGLAAGACGLAASGLCR